MTVPSDPPFVNRAAYRYRRVKDGARLLPALGTVFFLLPILWSVGPPGASTARTGLFVFTAWALLIVLARLLARWLSSRDPANTDDRDIP